MRFSVKAKLASVSDAVVALTAIAGDDPSQKTEVKSGDEVGDLVNA